jgi:hypothetical protein
MVFRVSKLLWPSLVGFLMDFLVLFLVTFLVLFLVTFLVLFCAGFLMDFLVLFWQLLWPSLLHRHLAGVATTVVDFVDFGFGGGTCS